MSGLGTNVRFSQSSLSTFYTCRRRFWLRYVQRLEWPASFTSEMAGWETALQRGASFHHWMHQAGIGVDVKTAVGSQGDELLVHWWNNWCNHPPDIPDGHTFSEVQLSVPLQAHRLVAQFDRLVVTADDRIYIGDWKTGRARPQQAVYAQSWQTRVYRYVAAEVGTSLIGRGIVPPENVVLVYWHANDPQALQPIYYSREEHETAREELEAAVREISELPLIAEAFPQCTDTNECKRCTYAALCERGLSLRIEPDEEERLEEDESDGLW